MAKRIPRITVDGIVINSARVLLVQRKNDPFKGFWALPGGFVEYGETTEEAVIREFQEETGLKTVIKKLVGVYSAPDRDPRGHTISVVYELDVVGGQFKAGDDAADVNFFNIQRLPSLSFDHKKIIMDLVEGL
jgi:8-oxo-dGTP diphosphatase